MSSGSWDSILEQARVQARAADYAKIQQELAAQANYTNMQQGIMQQGIMQGGMAQQENIDWLKRQQVINKSKSDMLHERANVMLFNRLAGVKGSFCLRPGELIYCHVFNDDIYVFYVFEGEGDRAGYIKEPIDSFPSDTLVTQLRLLAKA